MNIKTGLKTIGLWYYELCVTSLYTYLVMPCITSLYRYIIDMIYNRNSDN